MVPDSAPPLKGATRGVGAAILLKGRLSEPSGVVPPLQEETPPPNVSLHVVAYDRFRVVRIRSHVHGLSLVTVVVRSVVERFRIA